jgi:hypothetical protein
MRNLFMLKQLLLSNVNNVQEIEMILSSYLKSTLKSPLYETLLKFSNKINYLFVHYVRNIKN